MHRRSVVAEALRLRDEEALGARRVARRLGLPVGTVRDWHAGKVPLRWTVAFPEDERRAVTIYVSRKEDVARMDRFIGPKR